MPSNEEAGQGEGSSSMSNDVMRRFRSIQALYEATNPIEEECLISFQEPTTYSKASEDEAWRKADVTRQMPGSTARVTTQGTGLSND